MQQPTKELAQAIFEAHMETLWTMMQAQITDLEAFNEWSSKVAAAMTSTTLAFMFPIQHELTDDFEDHEADTQPSN